MQATEKKSAKSDRIAWRASCLLKIPELRRILSSCRICHWCQFFSPSKVQRLHIFRVRYKAGILLLVKTPSRQHRCLYAEALASWEGRMTQICRYHQPVSSKQEKQSKYRPIPHPWSTFFFPGIFPFKFFEFLSIITYSLRTHLNIYKCADRHSLVVKKSVRLTVLEV